MLPLPLAPALHPGELALALLYGLLTALAFALWPLGRAHDVPVSALFRDEVAGERRWPRRPYIVATALVGGALAALAVALAYDRRIAAIFVVAAAGGVRAAAAGGGAADGAARAACRAPRSPVLRLAIANIHRPGALTPSVVLSLGLGLALLVTVIAIDGNLRRQFLAALPDKAPSFFFVDIPAAEAERFDAFIQRARAARHARARADAARAHRGRERRRGRGPQAAARRRLGAAERPRHHLCATRSRPARAWSPGEWWAPDYQGPPLVSFEKRIADGLGLKLGDPVTVNVLGRNITATRRQSAHGRLAEPRHQFRDGVLARHLPRRAAHPHRHPDLSRRRHERRGGGAAQGGGGRLPGGHRRAREGRARRGRRTSWRTSCSRIRGASVAHPGRGGAGAGRRARGRPPAPRLRRRHPEDARRHPHAAARRPTRSNISRSALATALFGVAAGSAAAALSSPGS